MQAGILQQVHTDDGGEVLVVGNVLGKHDERDRHIGDGDGGNVAAGKLRKALIGCQEGEIGNPGHAGKQAEVDDLKLLVAAGDTDDGKNRRRDISNHDSDDERDQAKHLLAENGAQHGSCQRDEAADDAHIRTGGAGVEPGAGSHKITHRVARERKTDDGDRRSDDHGRHQLVDPLDAAELYDDGKNHIYKTCKQRAEDQAEVAEGDGAAGAGEGREHGSEEGKGASQENRAAEFCEKQVNDGSDTRTEKGCCLAHAVADNGGHRNGGGHDGEKLLERKQDRLPKLGLVFDSIHQIHRGSPSLSYFIFQRKIILKNSALVQ